MFITAFFVKKKLILYQLYDKLYLVIFFYGCMAMTEEELTKLFERGDCLTFDYTSTLKNFSYYSQMSRFYKKPVLLTSKMSMFALEKSEFHYFNNGILVCSMFARPEVLKQFKQLLRKKGYMLREERFYSFEGEKFDFVDMRAISELACQKYPCEQDLKVVELPTPEEFAQKLFDDNNVCYTASKMEDIHPKYRKFLALFSNGQFIVSDEYCFNSKTQDYLEVKDFSQKYKKYLYLRAQYVPLNYIEAIYAYAQKFDWFISEEEHIAKWHEKHTFPRASKDAIKMNMYIDELLRNNECLSVVNPLPNIMSPDRLKYALFADGSLIVDENISELLREDIRKELSEVYPNLSITLKTVPSPYIPEIYLWLLTRQKTAKQIYVDLLNERIEHLQNELKISKDEAQNAVLAISRFDSWAKIEQITETQARYLLNLEKSNLKTSEFWGIDYIVSEYKKYKG